MKIQHNYASAVDHFGPIAEQYCSLVDSQSALGKSEFLLQVYRMLPELIAEASRLPLISFDDDENEEQEATICKIRAETEMKQQEWGQLYDSLKEKLGDRRFVDCDHANTQPVPHQAAAVGLQWLGSENLHQRGIPFRQGPTKTV